MFSVTPIDRRIPQPEGAVLVPPVPRVLAVVAHPDDEYHFSVTLYKLVRELGGVADQAVITDGAGGHRYTSIAEQLYGLSLKEPGVSLRDIRRAETAVSGRVLGIRQHFFFDQPDTGFTLSQASAAADWNYYSITESLDELLQTGSYDFVFILLPNEEAHGHHKAVALLTLEAVGRLPAADRPTVLAAEADESTRSSRDFTQLSGHPSTRAAERIFSVSRKQAHPLDNALNYQIVANWVIAAHKSQGLFQMDAGRHDVEHFWVLDAGNPSALARAEVLFRSLHYSSNRQVSISA